MGDAITVTVELAARPSEIEHTEVASVKVADGALLIFDDRDDGTVSYVGYPLTSITCWRVTAPASAQADEPSRMKE